ncbi:MAG: hypothetical protein AAB019_05095 [Planctomycetota bacterium]
MRKITEGWIVFLIMVVIFIQVKAENEGSSDAKLVQEIEKQMTESRKIDLLQMKQLTKEEVLVVSGKYDQVEKVLDAFKITYTTAQIKDMENINLNKVKALLINCYHSHPTTDDKTVETFSPQAVKNIRNFVSQGGFLFASDWALLDIISRAFPKTITWNAVNTGDETVIITPNPKKQDHPFLKDVFPPGNKLNWKLDTMSTPVVITAKDKESIKILIESDDLEKKYKSKIVAVTFDYTDNNGQPTPIFTPTPTSKTNTGTTSYYYGPRRGTVLYVISHFYQRGVGLNDAEANGSMFQLIINFLIKAGRGNTEPKEKK